MTFTLQTLGIPTGSVGDKYDTPRVPCNHSGVDYETNQVATPFKSAISGKVVAPIGGPWGTISIKPDGSNDLVQYLHCSKINVNVGDNVTPQTVIGETGDVCPPGTCNGIHLHLQVVKPTGDPKYECWSRNYVDPETWTP